MIETQYSLSYYKRAQRNTIYTCTKKEELLKAVKEQAGRKLFLEFHNKNNVLWLSREFKPITVEDVSRLFNDLEKHFGDTFS